jgi:hypothetical protein
VGRLAVCVKRAEHIPERFFQKRKTFVRGTRTSGGDGPQVMKRTEHYSEGKCPKYNQTLVFTVYGTPREHIRLDVVADELHLNLSMEHVIGTAEFAVVGVLAPGNTEHNMPLVNPERPSEDSGTLLFDTQFTPFIPDVEELVDLPPSGDLRGSVGPPRIADPVDGATEAGALPHGKERTSMTPRHGVADAAPLATRGTLLLSRSSVERFERHLSGLLIVDLLRCENLKRVDMIGSSDPYVKLRVGAQQKESEVVKDSLNPVFNAQFQLDVTDWRRDVLEVEVHDWEMFKINIVSNIIAKQRMLGRVTIRLADIVSAGCKTIPTGYTLEPQGTITMKLRVKLI